VAVATGKSLPALQSAKVRLYEAFRESGMRKAELARRIGVPKSNLERLFDLKHHSRLDQLEGAFHALKKRIWFEVRVIESTAGLSAVGRFCRLLASHVEGLVTGILKWREDAPFDIIARSSSVGSWSDRRPSKGSQTE
jgi:hypothetical protein